MTLRRYRAKRNFKITSEPSGARRDARVKNHFVVQEHHARRLHYDFRLELHGVLLSWAVPKGPSLDPADKRLAVHVEDHPLEYRTFEGVIPAGQYGAGRVIIWDEGTWSPLNGSSGREQYEHGDLEFELHGGKLRGKWRLVRMKTDERNDNWLLIKETDRYAKKGGVVKSAAKSKQKKTRSATRRSVR